MTAAICKQLVTTGDAQDVKETRVVKGIHHVSTAEAAVQTAPEPVAFVTVTPPAVRKDDAWRETGDYVLETSPIPPSTPRGLETTPIPPSSPFGPATSAVESCRGRGRGAHHLIPAWKVRGLNQGSCARVPGLPSISACGPATLAIRKDVTMEG